MSKNIFYLKINNLSIVQLLFYAFPIFMLLASGYITAYATVLTIATLIFFYFNKIKIKLDFIDYLIFIFFLLSLTSTLLNIKILGYFIFFKSILDLRFVLFFFIIRNLIKFNFVDIKILFLTTLVCTNFLSLDIIYQHISGQDLFGNRPFDGRFNGIFEHEAIAGSYIQKFSLISLLFIMISNLNNKFIFLTIFINILGIGILLSLDRMPFLIYLFSFIILIILLKKYRLLFISNLFIILLIFTLLFKNYEPIKKRYYSLNNEINFSKIIYFFKKENNQNTEANIKNERVLIGDYSKIYKSVYYLWLEKPIIGSGVKSFQINCNKLSIKEKDLTCSTHPHNIYFEILINQGLLGFLIFSLLIILLINNFIKVLFIQKYENEKIINIIFFAILIAELWPLRSYGSIFQTVNGTLFWFLISLISSIKFIIKK
jgi:O-antigen ligase